MITPELRQIEIDLVSQIVEDCDSIEATAFASKVIDSLEANQPNERTIIKSLRNELCDLTFKFFIEKYPNSVS